MTTAVSEPQITTRDVLRPRRVTRIGLALLAITAVGEVVSIAKNMPANASGHGDPLTLVGVVFGGTALEPPLVMIGL